ncbi:MAG: helix-turn-helix transcriptional regulator [Clostridiales bacterium]|jgi:transcriptional regulator with XRE-family HTH domain|nr:helix-turn-helix transcriptional regulator [Clostridiales bacterium]
MEKTFGAFIKEKRLEKGINLRKLAELLELAPAYISDIENGNRNSPSPDKMEKLVEVLGLNEDEKNEMYDLAAKDRDNTVAPDISEYVKSNDAVRVALRKARNLNLGEQEWLKIIEKMENGDDTK